VKKVLKPATREESVFYSDFSGQCFGDFEAPVNVTFSFNYGSRHDGSELVLDLTDKETDLLLEVVRTRLTNESKRQFVTSLQSTSPNKARCSFVDFLLDGPEAPEL
jgi:hypothetical protein